MTPLRAGVLAITVIVVATIFAFARLNPFASAFELEAVFANAQNLKAGSEVRVAGVAVGKVTEVEGYEDAPDAALVRMEIERAGLPIHEDARLKVIPRIFLEGNYVVDLAPGSPSAPPLDSGATVPIDQTSFSVSFGDVLRVLNTDTRLSFRTLVRELSRSLDDGGARGFNRSIRYWAEAYRTTALASEALLGTRPGDIRRVLRGQQRTLAALNRSPEALKGLISNLNATASAFASEDDALQASIPALADVLRVGSPALRSLNASFPAVRAFSADALPGVRTAEPAIEAARPFLRQLNALLSEDELKRSAAQLRRTIPPLARLNRRFIPFLGEQRALSSCTSDVLVPFARTPIPDPDFPEASGEPFFKAAPRGFVGLAGESRIGDANGQLFRVQAGGGATTLVLPEAGDDLFSLVPFASLGSRPAKPDGRPPFRPGVPCETQEPPDLNAAEGAAEQQVNPVPQLSGGALERLEELGKALDGLLGGLTPRAEPGSPAEVRALERRLEKLKRKARR